MKPSFKKLNNLALAVFSFNRPQYLAEVIKSVETSAALEGIDFYFFQDGAINPFTARIAAREEHLEECIGLWERCNLPNKHTIRNQFNMGIGISQFKAKVLLFDKIGYEQVMFFEDDLVLSRNYIRSLRLMLNQFRDAETVGAVMCHGGHPRSFSDAEKLAYLALVRPGYDNLWGWGMWKERWQRIKPDFLKYYKFIKDVDYRYRNHGEILSFYVREGFKITGTSQDGAIYYALTKSGFVALDAVVHRGKYIGAQGEHMTSSDFDELGYSKVSLIEIERDATLDKFESYDERESGVFLKARFSIS